MSPNTGSLIVRGITLGSISTIVLRLSDFFSAIFLLRFFSVYEYGLYRLSMALYDFFSVLFVSGMDNVLMSDIAGSYRENRDRAKQLMSNYVAFLAVVGVFLWGVLFFLAPLFQSWVDGNVQYVRITSFLFLLVAVDAFFRIHFNVFFDFRWVFGSRIAKSFFRLVSLLVLFAFGILSVETALWSIILSGVFVGLGALIFYQRPYLFALKGCLRFSSMWGVVRQHGKWAVAEDAVNSLNQGIRTFLIKVIIGTEAVALLSIAQNLLSYAKSILPIRDILFPLLPGKLNKGITAFQLSKITKYSILLYCGILLGALFFIPPFVFFVLPRYLSALPVFLILSFGLPFFGVRSISPPVFYMFQQQRSAFFITLNRTALSLLLAAGLVYFFGIYGLAVEMLLTGVFTAMSYLSLLKRIVPGTSLYLKDLVKLDRYDKDVVTKLFSSVYLKITSVIHV